jgi:hypothetical protein
MSSPSPPRPPCRAGGDGGGPTGALDGFVLRWLCRRGASWEGVYRSVGEAIERVRAYSAQDPGGGAEVWEYRFGRPIARLEITVSELPEA